MIRRPPSATLFPSAAVFRSVVEEARPADKEGDRGDVDDTSAPALPHARKGGPGAEEVAFQVHGHYPVPLVFLDLGPRAQRVRSEEHTSELQSRQYLVCRLLL